MSCVSQEVKDIYYLLEHEFLPSDLALKVLPLLNKISKLGGKFTFASSVPEVQFSQYVPALEKLATLRLLQQVSNVYQTMKIDNLAGLIPFFDFSVVEKISVDAVKQKFLSMKVDHMKNVVIFCKTSLEADGLKDHLASFAEQLNKARQLICPPDRKQSKLGALLPTLSEVVAKEHKRLLARKSIIEKRKEEQERQLLEMEREEESKKLRLQKVNDEAEKIRLEKESELRRKQRIQREMEEKEKEEARLLLEEHEKRFKLKGKKAPPIDKANLSRQTLLQISLIEQQKQRQDIEKKLQKLAKTMDHLERAKREEAAPLIEAAYQQRLVEERILH
ncbi:eukaryotic translation initiation factor 3 subunit a, partial [Trifolium pratense]